MKNVVVTGGRGYIGTALTEKLVNRDYIVRVVSRSPGAPRMPQVHHCVADLHDPQSWFSLLRDADAVVHLSSHTDLRTAEADPKYDEEINVRPVQALVEAAHAVPKLPTVVFASAVTIAGPQPQIPVDETAPDNPCSVYDRHKLACEMILREATARGVLRACSLRLSNVYGYGRAPINANRGILNMMLERAANGTPLTVYGDGSYIRDFIHIEDVIEAFLRAITTPDVCDGGHYLIASGRGYTLAEAFEMIAEVAMEHLQRPVEVIHVPEPPDLHPIEKRNFIGDSQMFRARTGWGPRFDLRAGIVDYFVRTVRPVMVH